MNQYAECPKCGKHTVVQRSESIFQCLSCDFKKDFDTVADNFVTSFTKTWNLRWFASLVPCFLHEEAHEEWLGDLQEQRFKLIKAGIPRWKVFFTTVFGGFGLIRSFLWFKSHELFSRLINQTKRVFRR